jgi:hypothetical protein
VSEMALFFMEFSNYIFTMLPDFCSRNTFESRAYYLIFLIFFFTWLFFGGRGQYRAFELRTSCLLGRHSTT